jgi:hypothetical protein
MDMLFPNAQRLDIVLRAANDGTGDVWAVSDQLVMRTDETYPGIWYVVSSASCADSALLGGAG